MKKEMIKKEIEILRTKLELNSETTDREIVEAMEVFGNRYFDVVEPQRAALVSVILQKPNEDFGYLKESLENKDGDFYRTCDECGKIMLTGYCVDGGMEYYCEDDCLHKHYTEKQWEEKYNEDDESYWSEFYY